MVQHYIKYLLCIVMMDGFCQAQLPKFRTNVESNSTPLPFPPCRADNIDCLRRGLRTFFFLMDSGYLGMSPIDPTIVNSVSVALPEEQLSVLMRRINVTGARWTRLAERKFNLVGNRSGVRFSSDLHITGEIRIAMAARIEPYVGFITIDVQDVETNITYAMSSQRGVDNEDYILIGPERIAVRNSRTPTFFVQPFTGEAMISYTTPSLLEHMTNEIVSALMHTVVENFRLFASKIPVKYYYKYF